MAGAIAVQQHDDVVNLSTISHKKTGYRFAFGKYEFKFSYGTYSEKDHQFLIILNKIFGVFAKDLR